MATADEIAAQIAADALKAQSVSNDGSSLTRRSMADQIAGQKFVAANEALEGIANGTKWFPTVRCNPPGAGGTNVASDC